MGFLYLRYVGNPRNLWEWIQPYVRDTEVSCPSTCVPSCSRTAKHVRADAVSCGAQEINPSPEGYGKTVTVGEFVRDVFLEQVRPVHCLHVCARWHGPARWMPGPVCDASEQAVLAMLRRCRPPPTCLHRIPWHHRGTALWGWVRHLDILPMSARPP